MKRKKIIIGVCFAFALVLGFLYFNTSFIDPRYFTDPKFCIKDEDCVVAWDSCDVVNRYHYIPGKGNMLCNKKILGALCFKNQCIERTSPAKFQVNPSRVFISPDEKAEFVGEIKNTAEDGLEHTFTINVIPAAVSFSVCKNEDPSACLTPDNKTLYDVMKGWVSLNTTVQKIKSRENGYFSIIIKPEEHAKPGTYVFNAVACKDVYNYKECNPQNFNWHMQQISIIIK
ncbi:MAG: hypothetical protein DRP18_01630 [Candidatus Aenigmatarchaeota archaeon]|nr:MAG: hypothetical protein DRP18_01630 [Candidatus Aenigmarchaeota archaeon]